MRRDDEKKNLNLLSIFITSILILFLIFIFVFFSIHFSLASPGNSDSSLNEWLMYHGTLNQTGYYPIYINLTSFGLIWNYSTNAGGDSLYSSPVIENNIIYVSGGDNQTLYALNLTNNGTKIWSYAMPDLIHSSPAVADNRVYIGTVASLFALNATTGTQLWNISGGNYYAPLINNNILYMTGGIKLSAINATNGTLIWSNSTASGGLSRAPAIANGIIYFAAQGVFNLNFTPSGIFALNATNGSLIWNDSVHFYLTSGSPAISGNILYIVGTLGLFAINATTGTQIWNNTAETNLDTTPAVANGVVYASGGNGVTTGIGAFNATTGTQIWNYDIQISGETNNFEQCTPVVTNNVLFVGNTNRRFYGINITDGTQVWNYSSASYPFSSAPAIVNNTIYIADTLGNLYAFAYTPICVEIWTCGDWSSCNGGIQTRQCNQWNQACTNFLRTDTQACSTGGGYVPPTINITSVIIQTYQSTTIPIVAQQPTDIPINNSAISATTITVTTTKDVNDASLTISTTNSPSSSQIGRTGDTYQSFHITPNGLNDSVIQTAVINFKVNKTQLKAEGRTKDNVRLYRNPDNTSQWDILPTNFTKEDNNYYYFSAISPGFSTFVVFLSTYDCNPGDTRCFNNDVQLCLGNSTWLITNSCQIKCQNSKCITSVPAATIIYTSIIAIISIVILLTLYLVLKRIKKNKS